MKYSFIVPVYNCATYLEECVQSILAQTVQDLEIILVDDGSTDGSGALCDQLANENSCVRVFHKENGGAASARNRGLREARGEYLLFVDGDDTLAPSLLETADAYLSAEPQGLVIYGMSFDYYRKASLVRSERLSCAHSGSYKVRELLADYQSFFTDNALSSACNKVFSARLARENGLQFAEGMTLYEDYDFVLRYLMHISCVCCADQPLYHYRHDLDRPHLNKRVQNLMNVKQNLGKLLATSIQLNAFYEIPANQSRLLACSADLFLQLLANHLMTRRYSDKQLQTCLTEYCAEPSFRQIVQSGAQLSKTERALLEQIDSENFEYLNHQFRRQRVISWIKKSIKKLLNW